MHLQPLIVLLLALTAFCTARAEDVYQDPRAFLEEVFQGDVPAPRKLWVKGDLKQQIRAVMDHDLGALRIRYWARDGRSAWILEDLGKEQLITTGLVVQDGALALVRVLIYRESRGWEVKYPSFTDQFHGMRLGDGTALDHGVDGIAGATLSVRALTRLARLALLLDRHVDA